MLRGDGVIRSELVLLLAAGLDVGIGAFNELVVLMFRGSWLEWGCFSELVGMLVFLVVRVSELGFDSVSELVEWVSELVVVVLVVWCLVPLPTANRNTELVCTKSELFRERLQSMTDGWCARNVPFGLP